MEKKKIIIKRDKCISCGSCVACSEGKINFIDGKAWSKKIDYEKEEQQEIIDICPVDAIIAGDDQEYESSKKEQNVNDEELDD